MIKSVKTLANCIKSSIWQINTSQSSNFVVLPINQTTVKQISSVYAIQSVINMDDFFPVILFLAVGLVSPNSADTLKNGKSFFMYLLFLRQSKVFLQD